MLLEKKPDISVIIPCYNGSGTIVRCLQSLSFQRYKNFEVIIVDDFSTDNSYEIINNYSKMSPFKITIIKNSTNYGPSLSRKIGINSSKGEFLCFIDCDDTVEDAFLDTLYSSINKYNSDIAVCNFNLIKTNGKKIIKRNFCKELITSKEEFLLCNIDSFCVTMIKKCLFDSITFPNLKNGEDMAVLPLIFVKCNSISFVNKGLYNYIYSSGSLSNMCSNKTVNNLIKSFEFINSYIDNIYYLEKEFIGIRNLLYGSLLCLFKCSFNVSFAKKIVLEFERHYPSWHNNPYISRLPFYKRVFLSFVHYRLFLLCKFFSAIHSLLL